MPATSRAQFRFMQGVAHGSIKAPGLSRAQATEFVAGVSPKGLPERKTKPAKTTKGTRRARAGR